MKAIKSVIRFVCIPYVDEVPKKHTWYLYDAKVGTGPHTLVWVADKPELNKGDEGVIFIDISNYDMDDNKRWVKYPSESAVHLFATVSDTNDWLVFLSK